MKLTPERWVFGGIYSWANSPRSNCFFWNSQFVRSLTPLLSWGQSYPCCENVDIRSYTDPACTVVNSVMAGPRAGRFLLSSELSSFCCRPLSYCYLRRMAQTLSMHQICRASSTVLQSQRTGRVDSIGLRLSTHCRGQSVRPFQTDSGTIMIREGGERVRWR